ncbi:MAG: TIGR04283 family arsenosugar biosynthesis glycosyltransferase [Thermoleophilaceae bacterium]
MSAAIVIPALDEAAHIAAVLDHIASLAGDWEVVVADGDSRDATRSVAAAHPLAPRVIRCDGGRARALNAATRACHGDPIVYLHADSRLPHDAFGLLQAAPTAGGNFALRFDGGDGFARALGAIYAMQRRLGFYYGDSSVWVRRAAFERLGGYRELPIMDDYDFVRRLERLGPTTCLPGPALTSSRRWRALGIPRTVFSWVLIRWLFVAGVDPARLARLYPRVR